MKVLSASRYNFNDEKTGRLVAGCKITYVGDTEHNERFKGAQVVTVSGEENIFHQLPQLPADLNLKLQVTMKQGSPTVRVVGIEK